MKKEPRRCLNCQSLGSPHLAAACGKPTVCRTCGKEHWIAKCTEDDQVKHWCTNCKMLSHTSWDHTSPKFTEESKRLKYLNPESTYIYFPTDEPWTWEQSRNTVTNGTGFNDPDLRNTQHMELTDQTGHLNEVRNARRTPIRR